MLGLTRQTGNGVTVSFVRTADGQLIAATTGSSAYYLTDNVGSTVGIVNSSGVKTAAYAYDPLRPNSHRHRGRRRQRLRYAGGPFDATTGATKFGARHYDPSTGRFTQPDPSGQRKQQLSVRGRKPNHQQRPCRSRAWRLLRMGRDRYGVCLRSCRRYLGCT